MKVLSAVVAGVYVVSFAGCTPDFVKGNQSDVLLVIDSIIANAGSGPEANKDSAFLLSDVATKGSVVNDNVKVKVSLQTKDPLVGTSGAGSFNDVLLERYSVVFTRSDGHNAEGIDVPFAFSAPISLRVSVGGNSEAAFILVRHEAKDEPPLRNMREGGGLDILHTIATITLQGTTTTGKSVEVSGRIDVAFADFADEAI